MKIYQDIKNKVKTLNDENLMDMYRATMLNEDSSIEKITVHSALESEAEERGLIIFDEDEFEFVEA